LGSLGMRRHGVALLGQWHTRVGLTQVAPRAVVGSPLLSVVARRGHSALVSTRPKSNGSICSHYSHVAPLLLRAGALRHYSDQARLDGSVKMWNEERGFGFITPGDGGEDVFVHRSALAEGVQLSPGASVTYTGQWDDRKGKYRAQIVELAAGGGGAAATGDSAGAPRAASSTAPTPRYRTLHVVGSTADWDPSKDPMDGSEGGPVRHRLVIRSNAPQARGDKQMKREEFQILGDSDWDKRFYPAGGQQEEVVVLKPGDSGRPAAHDRGKGHGRNWAVEGRPGTAFDVVFDPETKSVSCESAFSEK